MSSPRDPRVFLWDAREAARSALRFASGKTFDNFVTDDLLRSGIERQLQIVGEALGQLSKLSPEIAVHVPNLRQIVALRNILVHGYASVDFKNIWQIVRNDVPALVESLDAILNSADGSEQA